MLLAVAFAAAAACGGQVSGNPDGGTASSSSSSGGSSGGSGGGSGGQVPLCPVDPPAVGSTCASPGQGCAYLIDGQCEGYRCTSASGWKMDPTVTCP